MIYAYNFKEGSEGLKKFNLKKKTSIQNLSHRVNVEKVRYSDARSNHASTLQNFLILKSE